MFKSRRPVILIKEDLDSYLNALVRIYEHAVEIADRDGVLEVAPGDRSALYLPDVRAVRHV